MQIPSTISFTPIIPITSTDVVLHTFVGISWHILLPYTVFGALLMLYSQGRLLRGQRMMRRETQTDFATGTTKSSQK